MSFYDGSSRYGIYFQRTRMDEYKEFVTNVKQITTNEAYLAQRILI